MKKFIIDLDGTIYKGNHVLNYAKEFFDFIQENAYSYKIFTNCSKQTPAEISRKLNAMGLAIPTENIVTSGCIVKHYLTEQNLPLHIYVVGSASFKKNLESEKIKLIQHKERVADYVVIGFSEDFNYDELSTALWHLLEGANFLVTNGDHVIPRGNTYVPHTGAICAYLECASEQKATSFGKESGYAGTYFKRFLGQEEVYVVGDRLDTDMVFALNNRFHGMLMFTGITQPPQALACRRKYNESFYDLNALCTYLNNLA